MSTQTDKAVLEYLDIEQDGLEILNTQKDLKGCTMQELLRHIVSSYIKTHSE